MKYSTWFSVVLISSLIFLIEGRKAVNYRRLLLVSFDGFRWDFLRLYNTSWFQYLTEKGATTTDGSYIPAFTTLSYPNHFTMVTGLHQESHGIVANTMYNPRSPRSFFSLRNKTALRDVSWFTAEPLWITAERAGKRTGTFFWPGSEVEFDGIRPKFWKIFDSTVTFKTRVDTVVQWLVKEDVAMATLYIEQPDIVGHRYGPFSKEMNATIAKLNDLLGYLVSRLEEEQIFDTVNLVLTSDHGMATCNASSVIPIYRELEKRKDLMWIIVGEGAMFGMKARPGKEELLFQFTDGLRQRPEFSAMSVFRRKDIPERLFYRRSRRVPDVVVMAEEGVFLQPRRPRRKTSFPKQFGCHGYDNLLPSMRPFFIAHGPQVQRGARVPPFNQVDLYTLLARLVGVDPRPNNGSWDRISKIYGSGPVFGNVIGSATNNAFSKSCLLGLLLGLIWVRFALS